MELIDQQVKPAAKYGWQAGAYQRRTERFAIVFYRQ
jgi:hypothetical protein